MAGCSSFLFSQFSLIIGINEYFISFGSNIFEPVFELVQMAAALRSYNRRRNVSSETPVIARRPRSLNNLPDEILQKIFSHIGPEELCLIIPKVCERWNNLTKDVVLWKTLSYECDVSSDISSIEEVKYIVLLEFRTKEFTYGGEPKRTGLIF